MATGWGVMVQTTPRQYFLENWNGEKSDRGGGNSSNKNLPAPHSAFYLWLVKWQFGWQLHIVYVG
jgi:hypothetical protein